MLLILMLAVAMLTITLLAVAPNYRRSIQRDREVEMIHRGVQYERAVRLYYRKNNSYPPSIDRLLETSGIRYLRKAYKDPMTPDGSWKIANLTDLAAAGGGLGTTGLTNSTGNVGSSGAGGSGQAAGSTGSSLFGSSSSGDQGNGADSQSTPTTTADSNAGSAAPTSSGPTTSTPSGAASTTPAAGDAAGSSPAGGDSAGNQPVAGAVTQATGPATTSVGGAGAVLGGLAMIGVISKSKAEGIHSFNDKGHYNQWLFAYDPSQDTGVPGVIPQGPYNPKQNLTAVGGTTTGTPGSPAAPGSTAPGTINPGTVTPGRMGSGTTSPVSTPPGT